MLFGSKYSMFSASSILPVNISHFHSATAQTSETPAFYSGLPQQMRQPPKESVVCLNTTCSLAAFTSCFPSCSTTGLPVTTVIVMSLRWFLHSPARNNSHLGLHNGGGSFTALWSGTQIAFEPKMIHSVCANCYCFIIRTNHFVLNTDVKCRAWMVSETNMMLNWEHQLKTGCLGKKYGLVLVIRHSLSEKIWFLKEWSIFIL